MIEGVSTLVVGGVILPVFLLILRNLIGNDVVYWMTLVHCYFNRPFDIDNNPETHDWAMILNDANGEWDCCSLVYHFGFKKLGNGVFIHRYDKNWEVVFVQRVSFGKWKTMAKGKLNPANLPDGLASKMVEMKIAELPQLIGRKFHVDT